MFVNNVTMAVNTLCGWSVDLAERPLQLFAVAVGTVLVFSCVKLLRRR
jgi:hypothetical protein